MAASTTNNPPPFSAGPFPSIDIAVRGSQSLQIADMVHHAQVSKSWNIFMKSLPIWSGFYTAEKLPPIEGRGAETKMVDYLFMSQHTCGARQAKCLGEFVGIVPTMSAKIFDLYITAMDPYEPSKKMSETWVVVVEPTHFHRAYDQASLFDRGLLNELAERGDVATAPENSHLKERGLKIPYSLRNLLILSWRPVTKGEGVVFAHIPPLGQCSRVSKIVKVTLMRKEVPAQSRTLTYPDQKERLKKEGHVLVPLCTRGYFDILEILNNNTCPDSKEPRWTFSRTSNEIQVDDAESSLAFGGFAPKTLRISADSFHHTDEHLGAAPAIPAEVLDTLDIGSGH